LLLETHRGHHPAQFHRATGGDGQRLGRSNCYQQGIYPPDIGKIEIDASASLADDVLACREIQSKDSFSPNGMTLGETPSGISSNGESGGV